MIITISGTAGSGKSTIAKMLCEKLELKHYSIGDLRRKMAEERGMDIYEFNKLGEKEAFTDKEADDYQTELGKKEDGFVIDGRLSFHFIPHSKKIFLDADLKTRAERIMKDSREKESFDSVESAMAKLEEREESDKKRYKQYYDLDPFDKSLYDIVIDTSKLTPEQIVDEILGKIEE
ncbi:(d)CMP kinase [Nanoarchaeota archaeon]